MQRKGNAKVAIGALLSALAASCGAQPLPSTTAAAPQQKVQDTLAQRLQACTPCHGQEGVATAHGYFPRIAGKPAGYLFEQLLNFKEGRRGHTAMRHLVQPLSTAYLHEIASHFAAVDLPYSQPERIEVPDLVKQRGRQLALEGDTTKQLPACVACHGQRLTGMLPATPGLLGLSKDYLTAQLGAWRNGLRKAREPDCMRHISMRLDDADIHAVSAYLASHALPAVTTAAAASPAPKEPGCAAPRTP